MVLWNGSISLHMENLVQVHGYRKLGSETSWVKKHTRILFSLLTWPDRTPFWDSSNSCKIKCPNGDSNCDLGIYFFPPQGFCMCALAPLVLSWRICLKKIKQRWCVFQWRAGSWNHEVGFGLQRIKLPSSFWVCRQLLLWRRSIGSICQHQVQVQVCPHLKILIQNKDVILADVYPVIYYS